jgi:hypothetical protein
MRLMVIIWPDTAKSAKRQFPDETARRFLRSTLKFSRCLVTDVTFVYSPTRLVYSHTLTRPKRVASIAAGVYTMDLHAPYNYLPTYQDQFGYFWPEHGIQQPPVANPDVPQFQHYRPPDALNPAPLHVAPASLPTPAPPPPAARVPVPKVSRKHQAEEPKYTARDLLDIVQTGIKVQLFTAKHGEKGKKLVEFGNAVRSLGIKGSDGVLKTRLQELLTFHEVCLLFCL